MAPKPQGYTVKAIFYSFASLSSFPKILCVYIGALVSNEVRDSHRPFLLSLPEWRIYEEAPGIIVCIWELFRLLEQLHKLVGPTGHHPGFEQIPINP